MIERTFPNGGRVPADAERNGLPVDRVTEVRVPDPYFYVWPIGRHSRR